MFGTFRYNKQTKNHDHVEISTASGVEARGYTSVACEYCRSRKLKCSGEKKGCDRCQAASNTCTYRQNSSSREDRKQQRRLSSHEPNSCEWSCGISAQPPDHRASQRQPPPKLNDKSTDLGSGSENPPVAVDSTHSISDGIIVASPSSWLDPSWELSFNDYAKSDHQGIDGLPDSSTTLPHEVAENGFPDSETLNVGIDAPDPNWISSPPAAMATNHDPFFHSNINADSYPNQGLTRAPNQKRKSMNQPRTSSPFSPVPLFGASKYSPGCQCLGTMACFLESMESYETAGAGIDTLLSCLGRGIVMCEDILACPNCNACADNSMRLSTLVQQLGIASKNIADLLAARMCNKSDPGTVIGETLIWFGGYRIEMPNLRLCLVYNAILLHFTHLRRLFGRIKEEIPPDSVAWRRIISTEEIVGSVFATIKRQLQREERGAQ